LCGSDVLKERGNKKGMLFLVNGEVKNIGNPTAGETAFWKRHKKNFMSRGGQ